MNYALCMGRSIAQEGAKGGLIQRCELVVLHNALNPASANLIVTDLATLQLISPWISQARSVAASKTTSAGAAEFIVGGDVTAAAGAGDDCATAGGGAGLEDASL